jgi:hypothetical protein
VLTNTGNTVFAQPQSYPESSIYQQVLSQTETLPPSSPVARGGLDAVLLTWEPSESFGVSGYAIYRKAEDEPSFTSIISGVLGLSYRDTDVITSTEYTYYLTSIDDNGLESSASDSVTATVGELRLVIPEVYATAGMTVTVPVQVENADGLCIAAMNIGIQYDPQVLSFVDVTQTPLTEQYAFKKAGSKTNDVVNIASAGLDCSPLVGPGTLFDVHFTVLTTATVNSSLDFVPGLQGTVLYDKKNLSEPVELMLEDGTLNLTTDGAYQKGDVNGDSTVTLDDVLLLLDIAVGNTQATTQQQSAGDVNGDEQISAADATVINYYIQNSAWLPVEDGDNAVLAYEPDMVEVTPNVVQARRGDEVKVPVMLDNAFEVSGGDVTFHYGEGLELTGVQTEEEAQPDGTDLATVQNGDGQAETSFLNEENPNPMWLVFEVDSNASEEETWVEIVGARLNDEAGRDFEISALDRDVVGKRGGVLLHQEEVADCNMDGTVNAADTTAILLRIHEEQFRANATCDANEDGMVDSGDITCAVLLMFEGPGACE